VFLNPPHRKSAKRQSLSEIVDFADQQYKSENFEIAASEYNRAIFFGNSNQDRLFLKIANCYFNLKDFEQSIVFYDKAYFVTQSDSIKNEAILGKSFSLIAENEWMLSLSELMNIDITKYHHQKVKMNFLQGIAYFGLHEDKLAEASFKNCIEDLSPNTETALIEKEFALIMKNEKRFNPKTAWLLSLIVPGSGQLYSKEYKEAANSAILLGGLFYLTVSFATRFSYLEAIVVMLPWFQRYYTGGANKAEKLAKDQQLVMRNNSYLSILDLLKTENLKESKTIN
jgi:tetratricopeptide (TPR) repeat protein